MFRHVAQSIALYIVSKLSIDRNYIDETVQPYHDQSCPTLDWIVIAYWPIPHLLYRV